MSDLHQVLDDKRRAVRSRPDEFERLLRARAHRRWRRRVGTIAVVTVLVVVTAWVVRDLGALRDRSRVPASRGPEVVRRIEVGPGAPVAIAAGAEGIWIADAGVPGAVRIDPVTGEVVAIARTHRPAVAAIDTHPLVTDVVATVGGIWTVDQDYNTVSRIDPSTAEVVATITTQPNPSSAVGIADHLWVASSYAGTVERIDIDTDRVVATIPLGVTGNHAAMTVSGDAVWVAVGGELMRIALGADRATQVGPVGDRVTLSVHGGYVLVADEGRGTITTIEGSSGDVVASEPIGSAPTGMVSNGGLVWVADVHDGAIRAIDVPTMDVVRTVTTGGDPREIVAGFGALWALDTAGQTLIEVVP